MEPMRVAVVGCGALAHKAHLPNVANNPEMQLVVACDAVRDVAESTQQEFGAERISTDWREVVDADDVDLIVLATHTNLRADLICPALEAGKPVYSEKPISRTTEEMIRILEAQQATGVPVCTGHNRRRSPAFMEMMRLLRIAREHGCDRPATLDRAPGRTWHFYEEAQTQALIRVCDDSRSWKPWSCRPGEHQLLNEMTHFFDLALLLMEGKMPVRISCEGSARANFVVTVTFEDGSMALVQQTLIGNFDYPKELIEVHNGHVSIAMQHHVEVNQRGLDGEPFATYFPLTPGSPEVDVQGIAAYHAGIDRARELHAKGEIDSFWCVSVEKGWYDLLDEFAKFAVRGEGSNPCDLIGAIRATMLSFKAWESCRLGAPVRICPEDFDLLVGFDG